MSRCFSRSCPIKGDRRATGRRDSHWALSALLLAFALSASPALARAASDTPSPRQEWLLDDQGREYRIERFDKKQPHVRVDGNRIRMFYGIPADLAGEDEQSFLIKVYRDTGGAGVGLAGPTVATPEEKAKIAATYAFDLPLSRTLSFEPFDEGLPRHGQWKFGFALADMNGDGHLDIVHGPPRRGPGSPVVFLGDGAGHWRRWQTSFPRRHYDHGHVAVADFNGDGHLDIALGMHLLGITVLLGDGTGNFKSASQGMDALDPHTAFSSHALVAVDWDGDGHVDLVALAEGPRPGMLRAGGTGGASSTGLALYRNRGDATWQKRTGTQPLAGDSLVLAQFRVQGRPWLVASSITRGQSDLVVRPGEPFTVEGLPGLRPGATVRAVAVADFDGDGHEDVAVAYDAYEGDQWRSGIDLLLRRTDGAVERRTIFVQNIARGITALGAGDLDGDGRPDLVALSGHGETLVLRNAGGGTFTREDVDLTERITGCQGMHVQVQDLDKDGRADIVAAFAGEPEGTGTYKTAGCPGQGSLRAWRSRPRS
jgi:hypothetical protein